ncbi:YeeE/YedE family protein [Halorarum salinum]|uniref:YeeE/YedE family protein n=1 Tax=Halorarum salinum TaxID=2743089 RepID=A0A7D5LB06_9EURY|nr:YeeE/YedE family protein [Halobaculum salinum]QLG62288.1 YeeE/YedE family protein [Halobaculum salinum]
MSTSRHPLFTALIVVAGLIQGFGLAYSQMARPEVVLNFLQLEDLGLLFVMGGAALVAGIAIQIGSRLLETAPFTGTRYQRREKSFDRNVIVGGLVFGVGWGLSGICPGAGYASLGIGNYKILWAIAGMFIGAYAQGYWRALRPATESMTDATSN